VTTAAELARDHAEIYDARVARRYFAKFERITRHLARVAAAMQAEGRIGKADTAVIGRYVAGIAATFRALGHKYLFTGREGLGRLTIDRVESGFPVFAELLAMASDAAQAGRHLGNTPSEPELRDEMVREIVGELRVPTRLQYALAQRLYYEALAAGGLFWARNDPVALWQGDLEGGRRRYLLHWAVYDSQLNLPVIYLMDVEDSGRVALPRDQRRWPEVETHLMAQAVAGLKLVTIASGFDRDFNDLHPKRLRRLFLGPMYSSAFTLQSGPLREVLAEARAPEGEDWALAWTVEELVSERAERERAGWFGSVERQVFALDPFAGRGAETGATRIDRFLILPERPFQVLAEKKPTGFAGVRKFVVGAAGRVLAAP
jgi:hypothetical protein